MNNASFITLSKDLGPGGKTVETYSRKMGYTHHIQRKQTPLSRQNGEKAKATENWTPMYLSYRIPIKHNVDKPWWLSGLHKEHTHRNQCRL